MAGHSSFMTDLSDTLPQSPRMTTAFAWQMGMSAQRVGVVALLLVEVVAAVVEVAVVVVVVVVAVVVV